MENECTNFEELSNEIIYEIFDFLDTYQAYEIFSNLNIRFRNLLTLSDFPIDVNLSNTSKLSFEQHYEQFFKFTTHRIYSLYISNPFIINLIFSTIKNDILFTRLKILYLKNIDLNDCKDLFDYLILLPQLSTLIIYSFRNHYDKIKIYDKLFRLSTLKYCKVSLGDSIAISERLLPIAYDSFSPIEHLIIDYNIYFNELLHILSYVPHVRRLSIKCLTLSHGRMPHIFSIISNNLTHVSIKLNDINLNQFQPIMTNLFKNLQVLSISTSIDNEYMNAQRWEHLIITHMPHLRIFDIQHKTSLFGTVVNSEICRDIISRFATLFWTKRKWFFTHQHDYLGRSNHGFFYSIQPYRRKNYILNCIENQCNYSCDKKNTFYSVRHIHIEDRLAIDNNSFDFPNAHEITFGKDIYISQDLIMNISNSMIPLSQLTKITINSDFICFFNIIKILCSIPNCKKLSHTSLSLEGRDFSSLKCTEDFQYLSHDNTITNITVKSCKFNEVELLVNLFPRLQHLTINVLQNEFQSIIRYLLSTNENTRYLHSLFIRGTSDIWIEKIMNIITEVRQQNDVSVKLAGGFGCYLWWE